MTQTLQHTSPIATSPVFTHMPAEHTGLTYGRTSGETVDLFIQHARLVGTDRTVPADLVVWIGDLRHDPCKNSTCFAIPFEDAWLLWQFLNSFTVAALIGVEALPMPDRTVPDIADLDTFDDPDQFTWQYRYAEHVGIADLTTFSVQLHTNPERSTPLLLLATYNEQERRHAHDQLVTLSLQEARVLYDFLARSEVQALFDNCFTTCMVAA